MVILAKKINVSQGTHTFPAFLPFVKFFMDDCPVAKGHFYYQAES
jgi:hypothetical protein